MARKTTKATKTTKTSSAVKTGQLPVQPVVFMFRPTRYEVVPPQKLAEWEQMMRERVGLNVHFQNTAGATATITFCPNVQDDSDQDQDSV